MPELGRQTILNVGALLFAWGLVLGVLAGALGYLSASSATRPAYVMALNTDRVAVEVARVEPTEEPPATGGAIAAQTSAEAEAQAEPAPETTEAAALEMSAAAPAGEAEPAEAAPVAVDSDGAAAPGDSETDGDAAAVERADTDSPVQEAAEAPQEAEPAPAAEAPPAEAPATEAPAEAPVQQAAAPAVSAPLAPAESEAGRSGEPAWRVHGESAATAGGLPRVAVVIAGLGLSTASTEAAIRQLPSNVTLSFTPYSRRLKHWIEMARANDHEVLLDLPMEPASFPNDDPGPYALLTGLSEAENQERLDWVLGRGTNLVGVTASMGSRFTTSDSHMLPVVQTLIERGLLYLDNRSTNRSVVELLSRHYGLPYVAANRVLDSDQASRIAINARLAEVERLAVENGFATAIGQPYPVTIERVRDWSAGLAGRGIALVPITALVGADRPPQLSAEQ